MFAIKLLFGGWSFSLINSRYRDFVDVRARLARTNGTPVIIGRNQFPFSGHRLPTVRPCAARVNWQQSHLHTLRQTFTHFSFKLLSGFTAWHFASFRCAPALPPPPPPPLARAFWLHDLSQCGRKGSLRCFRAASRRDECVLTFRLSREARKRARRFSALNANQPKPNDGCTQNSAIYRYDKLVGL